MHKERHTEDEEECKINQRVIALYEELFKTLWEKISITLGGITLGALFRRVIKKVSSNYPWIGRIEIDEKGVDFKNLHRKMRKEDIEAMNEAFNAVIAELLSFLAQMTGNILMDDLEKTVEKYIPEMKKKLS